MSLEDDIGSFSKRREREAFKPKEVEVEYDDDAYDDWEDEEEEDEPYADIDFRMYKLDELDKFNAEAKALDELIAPWWKNLPTIFSKKNLMQVGILEAKKKHLLADSRFENVAIANREESLKELSTFEQGLSRSHWKHFNTNVYGIIFYMIFAYFTDWTTFWYFLVAWSIYDMAIKYYKYLKQKEWVVNARTFINGQEEAEVSIEREEGSRLEDILTFNRQMSQEEKEHWSVKLYDAVANIFKGKK